MRIKQSGYRLARGLVLLLSCLGQLCEGIGAEPFGSKEQVRLHYKPSDGFFGDAIPFFSKGVYHVFYLKLPEKGGPPHWAHVSSRDLVRWREHPDPIPTESYTGSIIERDGVFHAFYTAGGVSHMTSRDLVSWTQDPANPVLPLDGSQYEVAWRDPHVFWNSEAKAYWMAICARTKSDGVNPLTGCLALAESKDLQKWKVQPPLWAPQMSTCIECPDLFQFENKWALIYFWHETRVRLADSPAGPWIRPACEAPDSFDLFAGKTMDDGKRRILIGWLPRRNHDCDERTWGGNMLLPREWYLLPDGTPATRCVPEILQACNTDATAGRGAAVFAPSMCRWNCSSNSLRTVLTNGSSALAVWTNPPADLLLRTQIRFAPGARATIFLRGQSAAAAWGYKTPLDAGYALHLDPGQGKVSLRKWYEWEQRNALIEIPFAFNRKGPTTLDLFLHGDILEVFLDQRRSLVSRLLQHPSGSLGLLAQDGDVAFEQIQISMLPAEPPKAAPIVDKTLVAWVTLSNLTQTGGSVLTLQDSKENFDAIVFGELSPARWMAGSDSWNRSQKEQGTYPQETADSKTLVQLAALYRGNQVTLLRNGREYARHAIGTPQSFGQDSMVVFGLRHIGAGDAACFAGTIEDARIYSQALTPDEIATLVPNQPSEPKPWAWWTFENSRAEDLMKNFPVAQLSGNARVEGGRLVLDGAESYALFSKTPLQKVLPKQEPGLYHPPGMSMWDTWYLQRGEETHVFHLQLRRDNARRASDNESIGHAVSTDLIHWKELPVALRKGPKGSYDDSWALFTGCAVEHSNTVYLFYCGNHQPAGRCRQSMCLATSPSSDGIRFTRYENNPIIEPDPSRYYSIHEPPAPFKFHAWPHIDCRDLAVIPDPSGKGWLGYVMMRRKGQTNAFDSACIALCRSRDLLHWEVGEPVCTPNRFNCFEVPDVFKLDEKYYMIALTGDVYGQANRWSDPNVTSATIVFAANRPEGPFIEVKDNLLLGSNGQQGYSARTVSRQGERLMFYTRNSDPYSRLSWPVKLVPRPGSGLNPVYWAGIDRAFSPPQAFDAVTLNRDRSLQLLPVPSKHSTYMLKGTVELQGAKAAGFVFGGQISRSGFFATIGPAGDPKGLVTLGKMPGENIQNRVWPVASSSTHRMRLIVVEQMVEVYVDDVLVINRCLPGLQPGDLGLLVRDRTASFKDLQYRHSLQ